MTPDAQGPDQAPATDPETGTEQAIVPERRQTLTMAMRRELLAELGQAIGEGAAIEGDRLIMEAGDDVAIHGRVEPDGTIVLTWWQTIMTDVGHPRWRDVAATLVQEGEAIYTSALAGGCLVEVERRMSTVAEAAKAVKSTKPVERVKALIAAFPEALKELPPEPLPDYLLPDRPIE